MENSDSSLIKPIDKLNVCASVNMELCGELTKIDDNMAEVIFSTAAIMLSDGERAVHTGFVYNSACYAALCAVNKRNSIVIASDTKFLAPIELGHEIVFRAQTLQNGFKKCEVKVEGFLLDIKVFEGIFNIAIFDKKLFKLRLKDQDNGE